MGPSCAVCLSTEFSQHPDGLWCPTCATFYSADQTAGVTLRQVRKDHRGRYLVRRKSTDPRFIVWASLILFTAAGLLGFAWAAATADLRSGLSGCMLLVLVVAPMWILLLREDASQVVIEIRNDAVLVREKLGFNLDIPRSEIDSLCVLCPPHKGRRTPYFTVAARLMSTETQTIVGDIIELGPALWLVQALAADLKIEAATQTK